ncbi:hypothetical protein [Pollutimonas subterranea]|nr:hypothetical protein [Pollutimonas subterranea]
MKPKRLLRMNPARPSYRLTAMKTTAKPLIEAAVLGMFLGLCAAGPRAAWASVDSLAAQQMSVRELMRIETDLALGRARKSLRNDDKRAQGSEGESPVSRSGPLKLVGIYGVGKKLLAEVEIGAQAYVYMRGHAFPVGMKASAASYQLRGISGSCVQLERKDEAHTLCLSPAWR